MQVFDTHVLSELRQGKSKQSIEVRTWAANKGVSQLFLTRSANPLLE